MNNKIIHDKYRDALREKYGGEIDKLDPIKKKFTHLTMVSDMINSQYAIFVENFRKAAETEEEAERVEHVFLIKLQHVDMLHGKIIDLHEKYIKNTSVIQSFDDRVIMITWMNIIVMCMHITKTILPMLNILNSQDIHIDGDLELTKHFQEFISLMKYMTNMSEEFEIYISKNMS